MVAPKPCKAGCSLDRRSAMPAISVRACSIETPGFSRPMDESPVPPRAASVHMLGEVNGVQTPIGTAGVVHPGGDDLGYYTDDLIGFPVYTQVRPVTPGSEAKRVCQSPLLIAATKCLPYWFSSGVNRRPRMGRMPSTSK